MSDLIDDRAAPTATQPATQHGSFVWYELLTSDPDAAAAFYGKVVGWTARDSGQEGMSYRLFDAGDGDVAGLMTIPPDAAEAGMRPGWLGYIGVADVDASVARAQAAGATVHVPPTDIPNVGRFSLLADP
jgi:predicted enzyme related to lactoylglutathione lyase